MAKQGQTVAQANRAIRQEALREYLSSRSLVEKVLENIEEIECLRQDDESTFTLNKLKVANDQRMRLISKYLPDLKATEITGDSGEPVDAKLLINFIPVGNED